MNNKREKRRKAIIDDGMNPEFVKDARFDGYMGIPLIKRPTKVIIPSDIVPFTKRNKILDSDVAIGFYEMDANFSEVLISPAKYTNEFCKRPFITPDCSLYRDAPLSVQRTNVYRNRAIGHYYQCRGVYVIPQIRWGNELTYTTKVVPEKIAFLGVEKHSIVAIGTYGCCKTRDDKYHFEAGLNSMLDTIEPEVVLVYGSMNKKSFQKYSKCTKFVHYTDWITRVHGGKR